MFLARGSLGKHAHPQVHVSIEVPITGKQGNADQHVTLWVDQASLSCRTLATPRRSQCQYACISAVKRKKRCLDEGLLPRPGKP